MGSKKRAQVNELHRLEREAHEAAKRAAARKRTSRYVAIGGGVVAAIVVAVLIVMSLIGNTESEPVATPSATASASEPSPEAPEGGWAASSTAPSPDLAEGRAWTASLATSAGDFTLELDGAAAPQAVASFVALASDGFFDGTSCHRLTTEGIYVLQCGDPTGTGSGGPEYRFGPIENAPADDVYPAGTLAMARVGNDGNSNGSQFFVVYEDSTIPSDGAGGYTVFGRVTGGLDTLLGIAAAGTDTGAGDGAPAIAVTMTEVTVS